MKAPPESKVTSDKDHQKTHSDREDFFIDVDECLTCGCCYNGAPENIRQMNESEHYCQPSTVFQQPRTPRELENVIMASSICMSDCIYYRGDDPKIIAKMHEAGVGSCVVSPSDND